MKKNKSLFDEMDDMLGEDGENEGEGDEVECAVIEEKAEDGGEDDTDESNANGAGRSWSEELRLVMAKRASPEADSQKFAPKSRKK